MSELTIRPVRARVIPEATRAFWQAQSGSRARRQRTAFLVLLLFALSLAGCDWFSRGKGAQEGGEQPMAEAPSVQQGRGEMAGHPTAHATPDTMPSKDDVQQAREIMSAFAERTGVRDGSQQRYLWTDAFAVCNFLGLARATSDERYRTLALSLIARTHEELARYRTGSKAGEWLEGPLGSASSEHPTRAGVRIGKPLPERGPDEAFDSRLEWERDGQYFHYLTKWMHALDQTARVTGEPHFNRHARELAETAHEAFTYSAPGSETPRMYWKMSVDLSRPLVPSMGHHDPLDGYLTSAQLMATAELLPPAAGPALREELESFAQMVAGRDWTTTDPLGLGGLLMDAYRAEQLMGANQLPDHALLGSLLQAASRGLSVYVDSAELSAGASTRLAFRELGLAIGLHAVERMRDDVARGAFAGDERAREQLAALVRYVPLARRIERFWLNESNQRAATWQEHLNINAVMLATSLVPVGMIELPRLLRPRSASRAVGASGVDGSTHDGGQRTE